MQGLMPHRRFRTRGKGPSETGACFFLFLILGILIANAGCAKIAEPRAPEIRIPKAATDLAVRQVSDHIVLSVSKPEANTNGSTPVILGRIEVYRLTENPTVSQTGSAELQFLQPANRILSLDAPKLAEILVDNRYIFQDRFPPPPSEMFSHAYRYAVLFVNKKNQSAGLSNQAAITPVPIPPPPGGIALRGTQGSIQIQWAVPAENMDGSVPPRNAGYNIYRTEDPKKFPVSPLNANPVTSTAFEDTNFRFETTYYYAITTVGSLHQPYPESLPSPPVSISTKDVFPPEPPADFSALIQGNAIVLLWEPSPSADVAGYRLYRREKGTSERRAIQPELVRGLSFRDTGMEPDKQYEYEIQAVDAYGNASPPLKADSEQR